MLVHNLCPIIIVRNVLFLFINILVPSISLLFSKKIHICARAHNIYNIIKTLL